MYQIRHRHISYSDVYLSQTPCKEAVTDSTFFKFNSEDITRLRQQIGQLLDYLSTVYKNFNKQPTSFSASTSTASIVEESTKIEDSVTDVVEESKNTVDPLEVLTADDSNVADKV